MDEEQITENKNKILREFEVGILDSEGIHSGKEDDLITAIDIEDAINQIKTNVVYRDGSYKYADGIVIVATDYIIIKNNRGYYDSKYAPIVDNRPMTIIHVNRGTHMYY